MLMGWEPLYIKNAFGFQLIELLPVGKTDHVAYGQCFKVFEGLPIKGFAFQVEKVVTLIKYWVGGHKGIESFRGQKPAASGFVFVAQ